MTSHGRNNGFTIAGKNWKGRALSDREARLMRDDLEKDKDSGIKTAVAVGLVLAADSGKISIMNQAAPRQLTMIAINAVEEAKTVLKVKKGIISVFWRGRRQELRQAVRWKARPAASV